MKNKFLKELVNKLGTREAVKSFLGIGEKAFVSLEIGKSELTNFQKSLISNFFPDVYVDEHEEKEHSLARYINSVEIPILCNKINQPTVFVRSYCLSKYMKELMARDFYGANFTSKEIISLLKFHFGRTYSFWSDKLLENKLYIKNILNK